MKHLTRTLNILLGYSMHLIFVGAFAALILVQQANNPYANSGPSLYAQQQSEQVASN